MPVQSTPVDPRGFGYLAYLKQLVHVELYPKDEWVLDFLFACPYYWRIQIDDVFYHYGMEIRQTYIGLSGDTPCIEYLDGMVSVLEFLIALSIKGEDDIMHDPALGDRSYIWFWMMINKLRLDDCTTLGDAQNIVSRLLDRDFMPNGEGSICGPFLYHIADMRQVTFWYQFHFWADENYTFDC